jgi:hypothetical protein
MRARLLGLRCSSATALQRPVDERLAHSQEVTDLRHSCTSFSVACAQVWRGAGARVRGAHLLVTISFSNSSPLRFLIAATDRSRRQRTRQAPIWRARRLRQTRVRPEGLCFWSKSTSLQVSKSPRETFGEFYVQPKTAIKTYESLPAAAEVGLSVGHFTVKIGPSSGQTR